jgi:integrase
VSSVAKPRTQNPKLRHHKASGRAYVVLNGKTLYLGNWGTEEAEENYYKTIAEWLSCGRQLDTGANDVSVNELIARFWTHAESYYRAADGTQSRELENFRLALHRLKQLYGHSKAAEFGPRSLRTIRQKMIADDCSRGYINQSVCRIKMMFKWAVGEEFISGAIYHALSAVPGLKRGRSEARDTGPVKPVPQQYVEAIASYVSRQVWAIIQLQLLTAARPGEILIMRPCDIDRSGKIWVYSPADHKTAHHGHDRKIYIGPKGQEVLRPFLLRPSDAYCFSPAEAEAERRVRLSEQRQIPLKYGNVPGSHVSDTPARTPGDLYDVAGYRRAITRGIEWAFPAADYLLRRPDETKAQWQERLTEKERAELKAWYKQYHWHPHQLRHNAATYLRKEFGLETARVILGHRSAIVTEVYAELDQQRAIEAMTKVG